MQALVYLVLFLSGILLPHWVMRFDERRLSQTQLQRSFNQATHWSAVVAFSVLCLPVYFTRTRRSLWGFLLGVGWTSACVIAQAAIDYLMRLL